MLTKEDNPSRRGALVGFKLHKLAATCWLLLYTIIYSKWKTTKEKIDKEQRQFTDHHSQQHDNNIRVVY
jgi:hypothetical protein